MQILSMPSSAKAKHSIKISILLSLSLCPSPFPCRINFTLISLNFVYIEYKYKYTRNNKISFMYEYNINMAEMVIVPYSYISSVRCTYPIILIHIYSNAINVPRKFSPFDGITVFLKELRKRLKPLYACNCVAYMLSILCS